MRACMDAGGPSRNKRHHHSMSINPLTASLANNSRTAAQHGVAEKSRNSAGHSTQTRLPDPSCKVTVAVAVTLCGFFSFQLAPSSESFRSSPPAPAQPAFWLATGRQQRTCHVSCKGPGPLWSTLSSSKHMSRCHTHAHTHTRTLNTPTIPRYAAQGAPPGRGPPELHRLQAVGFMLQSLSQSFSSLACPDLSLSCLVQPRLVQSKSMSRSCQRRVPVIPSNGSRRFQSPSPPARPLAPISAAD